MIRTGNAQNRAPDSQVFRVVEVNCRTIASFSSQGVYPRGFVAYHVRHGRDFAKPHPIEIHRHVRGSVIPNFRVDMEVNGHQFPYRDVARVCGVAFHANYIRLSSVRETVQSPR